MKKCFPAWHRKNALHFTPLQKAKDLETKDMENVCLEMIFLSQFGPDFQVNSSGNQPVM